MKYMLSGSPPSQLTPSPSPSFFFLRRRERKLLFRIHCRECSWTGNLFSPEFDTARPLVLLLTLAKHSDNYFCWFQIAFSSRVWSQQVFFACWAYPFRHHKRSRGKEDGFFFFFFLFRFYPVALWHSLNGPFVSKQGKVRERLAAETRIDSWGRKQSQNTLIWWVLLQKPAFPHVPTAMHPPMWDGWGYCVHRVLPLLLAHVWSPKDPASNLQSFIFLPPGAIRSVVPPKPP